MLMKRVTRPLNTRILRIRILPIVDNVFLPSGDIDIDKSILNLMKLIKDQIKFMKKECKF